MLIFVSLVVIFLAGFQYFHVVTAKRDSRSLWDAGWMYARSLEAKRSRNHAIIWVVCGLAMIILWGTVVVTQARRQRNATNRGEDSSALYPLRLHRPCACERRFGNMVACQRRDSTNVRRFEARYTEPEPS